MAGSGNGLRGCLSCCQRPLGTCSSQVECLCPGVGEMLCAGPSQLCRGSGEQAGAVLSSCLTGHPLPAVESMSWGRGVPGTLPWQRVQHFSGCWGWGHSLSHLLQVCKSLQHATPELRLGVFKTYKFLFLSCMFFEVSSEKFCRDFLAPSLTVMDLLDLCDFCSHPLLGLAGPTTKESFTQRAKSF